MASPLLNTKRYCLLTSFWSFKTSVEVEQSTQGSQVRIWFVDMTLVLMSITQIWWSSHFILSMRPSRLWIRREPGELRVMRSLNAGLVHYEIRVWVSKLRKFSESSSVKLRRGHHLRFTFQSLNAGLMCWALCLSFNTFTFFFVFMILTLCSFLLQWGIV